MRSIGIARSMSGTVARVFVSWVRRCMLPRSSLLSQATTPPRACPKAPASRSVTGVLPEPPFGFATTTVTGRRNEVAAMSRAARSDRSAVPGRIRSLLRTPFSAGASRCTGSAEISSSARYDGPGWAPFGGGWTAGTGWPFGAGGWTPGAAGGSGDRYSEARLCAAHACSRSATGSASAPAARACAASHSPRSELSA